MGQRWSGARRRGVLLGAAGVLSLGLYGARSFARPPRPKSILSSAPAPAGTRRHYRTVWAITLDGHPPIGTGGLLAAGRRLFYSHAAGAGCLSLETGRVLWRRLLPLLSSNGYQAPYEERAWCSALDADRVFLAEYRTTVTDPPPRRRPFRLLALDARTGKTRWQRHFAVPVSGPPYRAAGRLLIADANGFLAALSPADGRTLWRRRLAHGWSFAGFAMPSPQVLFQAEGDRAVAAIGGRLEGFSLRDGRHAWQYLPRGSTAEAAESGTPERFALRDGVVYAVQPGTEMVAVDAASGRLLWRRTCPVSGPAAAVLVAGDLAITAPFSSPVAVSRREGRTRWSVPFPASPWGAAALTLGNKGELFVPGNALPDVAGSRKLLSLSEVPTLRALDLRTGRERWRWQPPESSAIQQALPLGEDLIVSNGSEIRRVQRGAPPVLPADPIRRQWLARQRIEALRSFGSLPGDDWAQKWVRQAAAIVPAARRLRPAEQPRDPSEALPTLLRLGDDAIVSLLDAVRADVRQPPPPTAPRGMFFLSGGPSSLEWQLTLLADLGGRGVIPELRADLAESRSPAVQAEFATALIRLDDPRCLAALLDYARSSTGDEPGRRATLYYLARSRVANAGPEGQRLQSELTRFLIEQLRNRKATAWLRSFARFELLNDRGENARRAALAARSRARTARLLLAHVSWKAGPYNDDQWSEKPPTQIHLDQIVRDRDGTWWGLFYWDYLGANDAWLVRSADRRHWTAPAFAVRPEVDLTGQRASKVRLRLRAGRPLIIYHNLRGRRAAVLTPADLTRDRDGDGLPDRLERRIGSDPERADTNANGISDGQDKNPLHRPHPLSDEEGIYQAVLEALCQLGRAPRRPPNQWAPMDEDVGALGHTPRPLPVPLPDGSRGIEVLAHPGVVLPLRGPERPSPSGGRSIVGGFRQPYLGLDGVRNPSDSDGSQPPVPSGDPFVGPPVPMTAPWPPPFRFREYFPYQRKGNHARVGWDRGAPFFDRGEERFDVEVRKFGGRWQAIECRMVYQSGRWERGELVTPSHPWRCR